MLLDGRPTRACITPVRAAAGHAITTIEGLAPDGRLHPVQQAFLDEGALQCGFCTPGLILAGAALLAANPHPTAADVTTALSGNICRCGTYPSVVAAVLRAAGATP